jgi:hypothetical protein
MKISRQKCNSFSVHIAKKQKMAILTKLENNALMQNFQEIIAGKNYNKTKLVKLVMKARKTRILRKNFNLR